MSTTVKNILGLLILLTVAFGGYYFVAQESGEGAAAADEEYQAMLAKTSVFMERSQELSGIMIDTSLLEDERFRTLKTFSRPVAEVPIGRPDPFVSVSGAPPTVE